MSDVGIRLTMTENASSIAPKISESLRGISQAGEDMKEALELGDLEEKYKSFADRVDKLHDVQKESQRITTQQALAGRARGVQAPIGRVPEEIMKTTAGAVQRVGATGDVTEAAPGILGTIKGMLSAAGPAEMIAGAAIGVTAAGGLIANALSKQYEKVMPEMMDLTAIMGELGGTVKETSDSFGTTMKEASSAASKFGYSLEVGAGVMRTFAEVAGVGRGEAAAGAGGVMAYARGMGVTPGALARIQAMGTRFGQGNVLGAGLGGLEAAGMGRGQYTEFLNATLNIFEEGLSRGIVKGWTDITATQAWIANLGDAFKGQYGLNLYRKMEGAVTGATALENETNVVIYRAVKRLLGGKANYLDVLKEMETEMTEEKFTAIIEEIRGYTGGIRVDMVEWIRSIFGTSVTTTEKLLDAFESGNLKVAIKELKAPVADSPELKLLGVQEEIREKLREVGKEILPMKAGIIKSAEFLIKIFHNIAVEDEEERTRRETREAENISEVLERAPTMRGRGGGRAAAENIIIRPRTGEETIESESTKDLIEAIKNNMKSTQDLTEEMKKPTEIETEH